MTSCSSETLCLLPSKQISDPSPSTDTGMHRDTPSRVPTQDISFLYHQDGFLSAAGCGLPVQRIGDLHQWLHLSSLAPECPSHLCQHLIMFLFGDCLEDVALNVGDAPIGQGIIVIKFLGVRGLIFHIIAYVHIDNLNVFWCIAPQGEEEQTLPVQRKGTFGREDIRGIFFPSISHSYPVRYRRPDPSSPQPPQ